MELAQRPMELRRFFWSAAEKMSTHALELEALPVARRWRTELLTKLKASMSVRRQSAGKAFVLPGFTSMVLAAALRHGNHRIDAEKVEQSTTKVKDLIQGEMYIFKGQTQ